MINKLKLRILFVWAIIVCAGSAFAIIESSFGVNFMRNATGEVVSPEGSFGFGRNGYPAPQNWTNVSGSASGSLAIDVEDAEYSLGWTAHGTWSRSSNTAIPSGLSDIQKLLYSYLDDQLADSFVTLTVSGLPENAAYAVALLLSGDGTKSDGNSVFAPVVINGKTYSYKDIDGVTTLVEGSEAEAAVSWGSRKAATAGEGKLVEGTNVMFVPGLAGSELTITRSAVSKSKSRLTFAGIQIWINKSEIDIVAQSTDAETQVSFDAAEWGSSVSMEDVSCLSTMTLHARNTSAPEYAVFEWSGVPSDAVYSDERRSSVTFKVPVAAGSATVGCRTIKALFTATSTDGETEFSLDGGSWSGSIDTGSGGIYVLPSVTLRARTPNFAGAHFEWTGLPEGAVFDNESRSSVTFAPPLEPFAVTCGARRATFTAAVTDNQTELSFDGDVWSSSLSLVDVYAGSNMTVRARNTAGTDWAHFMWEGLPAGSTTADRLNSAVTLAIPLEGATLTCSSVSTYAVNTWTGGSGAFEDPAMWSLGVAPTNNHDVVIPAAPTGTTNTITVTSAFYLKSLEVGGGDGTGLLNLSFANNSTNTVSGDVTIRSGAVVTHELGGYRNAKTVVKYTVCMEVGGDMTIDEGASIDVTAKGHIAGNGPLGTGYARNQNRCSPHGGRTVGGRPAYGSALTPCMYGSANEGHQGGGVVRLVVGGNLSNNGSVKADGTSVKGGDYGGGAGGAVWITAGVLSGAGSISTDAGDSYWGMGGCGGRIAIYQTDPSAIDFSAFTGTITSSGACSKDGSANGGRESGSAGTIYLQAYGQTVTNATLIIDNIGVLLKNKAGNNRFHSMTPLHEEYDCGVIGNLIVRNAAHVDVSNTVVKVYGNITVDNSRFKAYSGTLELCGKGDATISGTNLFCSVSCTVPGKTLKFGTGENNEFRIADDSTLTLKGSSEEPLVLKPAVADETWKITLATTTKSEVSNVAVDHSDASGGVAVTAYSSTDGGNNENWSFPLPLDPGDTLTWNGSYSGLWSDVANWTDKRGATRLPFETDVVVIPASCENYPAIMADTLQNSISVAEGASLVLSNGARLEVTNVFTVAGTFTVDCAEEVFFSGRTLEFSGSINPANSTFTLAGGDDATLDFGDNVMRRLYFRKTGGKASFMSDVSAETFDALATNAVTLAFAEGVTLEAKNIYCRSRAAAGAADPALMTLCSIEEGKTWNVDARQVEFFSGVKVRDSAARELAAHGDSLSVNLGNNSNWTFGATVAQWIGGTGDFDSAANWYPAAVPGADTDVFISGIDGASAVTASGNVTVRSLKMGTGTSKSSLDVKGVLATSLDVAIETNATLTLNSPVTDSIVGRDFIVRSGGTATHTALASSCNTLEDAETSGYRFRLDVLRDILVERGGKIDVTAKGYSGGKGPLAFGKRFNADSNGDGEVDIAIILDCGGHAGYAATNSAFYKMGLSYGSMFEPLCHGSGGKNANACGGGVVKIKCAGDMAVDGVVSSDGKVHQDGYGRTGAGGSVWLDVAGEFSGAGEITARGGDILYDSAGAGGRIAIYCGSDSFTGSASASTGEYTSHTRGYFSGSGTVLKKVKGGKVYDVTVDNDLYHRTQRYSENYSNGSAYWNYFVKDSKMRIVVTDFPSKDDLDKLDLLKNVRLSVGHLSAINLTQNLKVYDIDMNVNTGSFVRLNGYTLRVLSSEHKNARGWAGTYEDRTRLGGEIIWGAGFTISIR